MTKTRSYRKIHDELDTLLKHKILVFAELGNKSCRECIEAGANVVIARVSCDANQNWNEMRQLFKDTSAAVQSSSNDKQQEKVFIAAKLNLSNDICEGEFNFDLAANKVTDVLEELDFAVVDLLILDSIQDTRIARAAIFALETFKETEKQVKDIPLVISCLVEENGRLKCGQTVDAFSGSVRYANPLSIGVECNEQKHIVSYLKSPYVSDVYSSLKITGSGILENWAHIMILHDECTVEEMKQCVESAKRKETPEQSERSLDCKALLLSGSNVLRKTIGKSGKGNVDEGFSSEIRNSLIIGQRCDIANIAKFREIILKIAELNDEICKDIGDEKPVLTPEGNSFIYAFHGLLQLSRRLANTLQRNPDIFENNLQRLASIQVEQDKALEIARSQIAMGADVINLLFDPISYISRKELPMPSEWMKWFINLVESDYGDKKSTIPICSIPLCINSGKTEVILEGLKYARGRAIANYLSFYNGKEQFIQDARVIKKLGPGAIIAFAQDYKEAPAKTPEKKANLCIEMFKLLVETVGFHPNEVILDPVVTRTPINSQPGANEFGETFFEAISLIRNCSDLRDYNVRLIGGITAVSQFYRGYSKTRIDLNRSFLKHCLEAGMHHVIMEVTNIAHEIKQNLVEDLVTNKDPEAKQKLKAFSCAENYENEDQ